MSGIEAIGQAVVDLCHDHDEAVRMVIEALLRDGEAVVPPDEADALDGLAAILADGLEAAEMRRNVTSG